jgi:hypothetical protein
MRKVVVVYQAKPDQADENERLVARVFEELNERKPSGLRYATFRLADGVSFVHVASIETDDGLNPLSETSAFAEFQREIKDRVSAPPSAQDATVVGSYRFFGG